MQKLCFKLNGETVCVPVPVLLEGFKPLPHPDPRRVREILDSWIVTDGPTPSWKTDFPVLATLSALADLTENAPLAEAITDVMRFYTERFAAQLPEGMTVEIEEAATARR